MTVQDTEQTPKSQAFTLAQRAYRFAMKRVYLPLWARVLARAALTYLAIKVLVAGGALLLFAIIGATIVLGTALGMIDRRHKASQPLVITTISQEDPQPSTFMGTWTLIRLVLWAGLATWIIVSDIIHLIF